MIQQKIAISVDNVIFTIINDKLQVLLFQRSEEPFKGMWTIPGGLVGDAQTLEESAYQKLEEKTNVKDIYLEQLYTFSDIERDPRGRTISTTYMALVAREKILLKTWVKGGEVKFFPIEYLPKLWFDHKIIVDYAVKRLKRKLEYTNVAQYILPEKFTLTELQKAYEVILDQKLDVRNFRKKIDKLGILRETGEKKVWDQYRPARLFEFINKEMEIISFI